ncbi:MULTISPECIES: hypothetical protein [unclassified Mycobacterium]|uniref:hypothetical protein n=1 Tax=unclassified Mycobacterium TaxID=2642494 RepID=UPI00048DA1DC|nr:MULTISPECIES: hypothetical protein [unclassified Mycobacterium]SEB02594.1 hypothetical protein SAMN04488580_106106 [Mycobacterium sp. 283mftsu]
MSDVPKLIRPAFFDGQALTATDLNAVQTYHRDLLWLHQKTMHGSGIASGLSVTARKGDKVVSVAAGYAIDTSGRSIISDTTKIVDIPQAVSGPAGQAVEYYLTIAYSPDSDLAPSVRGGACNTSGAVWRAEQPSLKWKVPEDAAQDVVLCGIKVFDCKLSEPLDLSLRRSALPDKQPFVFAGWSAAEKSKWEIWQENGNRFGLKAAVDTSEAGFVNTPKYQAMVVGERTTWNIDGMQGAVDGHVQVDSATADGFRLTMTLPKGSLLVNPEWALREAKLKTIPKANRWLISWMGVEY